MHQIYYLNYRCKTKFTLLNTIEFTQMDHQNYSINKKNLNPTNTKIFTIKTKTT